MVNRVVRSTSVPIADVPAAPVSRSPSQCPGTARRRASLGVELGVNPDSHPRAGAPEGAARHSDDMSMNMYLINALLVLMVIRQVREHSLDLRALAVPLLAVAAAAVMFLHSVPAGGNDIALELLGVSAGAAMGAAGGLATRLRRGADGRPPAAPALWRPACGSPGPGPGWPSPSPPLMAPARRSGGSPLRTTSQVPLRGWRHWS